MQLPYIPQPIRLPEIDLKVEPCYWEESSLAACSAMLAGYFRPWYFERLSDYCKDIESFGPVISPTTHKRKLDTLGIEVMFCQSADIELLKRYGSRRVPLLFRYLTQGLRRRPIGSWRWAVVVGYQPETGTLVITDPIGQPSLTSGKALTQGCITYTADWRSLDRRLSCLGRETGWVLIPRKY